MKKLMKLAAILGIVYVGATFFGSFYAQKQYDQLMSMVEEELSVYQVKLIEHAYERGVFTSKARVVVVLPLGRDADEGYRFDVSSDIHSGPWLGGSNFGLGKIDSVISPSSGAFSSGMYKLWGGKVMVTSQTIIGFFKGRSNRTEVLPFQYTDENGTIDFRGGTGSVDYPLTQLSFPFYQMKGRYGDIVTVENIQIQTTGNAVLSEFSGTMNIGRVTSSEVYGGAEFEAQDLLLDMRTVVVGDLQSMRVKGRMTHFYEEKTARIEMDYEAENINYDALRQLQGMKGLAFGSREIDVLWFNIIKPRPTVNVNLTMTQDGKTAFVRGNFKFAEFGSRDFLMNPLILLLERGVAYVEVKIPVSFVDSAASGFAEYGALKSLLQQGNLIQQGQDYVGVYSFEKKTLMVNGKKVSLF